ncbi:unnamed protein product [Orchesella dallaii]|uniref:Carboxylic ester hydrolase n=1 Tax=Orchesella dallaii TaxID=48710 RepID=A0ABP1QXW2_9HEXA
MVVVFLFNLMCAIVSCDPYYNPPTPGVFVESSDNSLLTEFISRTGRNLDGNESANLMSLTRPPPIVETKIGTLEGYFMKVVNGREVYAFDGIKYAEKPERFRSPVPKRPWRGVRQAKKPGHLCVQMHGAKLNRVLGHEDCLTLNIYTPQIPVQDYNPNMSTVIWFHGGSFIFGAGSEYGPAYLLQKDVILVTVNYRLGVLGFLSTGDEENPGNWGLKDQALAIKWVVDNISRFGGNPKSITLMGQSAGAVTVHLHMMSNMTKHLFQRAVGMSGSAFVGWAVHTPHQARKWAEKLARFMRCPTSRGTKVMMNCFRTRDPNFLTANLYNLYDIIAFPPVLLRPVIEPDLPGAFLTLSPKEAYEQNQVAKIPFIASNTREEADFIRIFLTGFGIFRLWLRHWEVLGPTMLDYRRITDNTTAVTHAIADFYFNGHETKDIAKIKGQELSRVGTDRYFNTGNRKTLEYHSKIAPTYSYIFGYKNPKGFANLFGMDHKEYGVSHSEDVSFIYNSSTYWESFDDHNGSLDISKLVVSLFTNFISTGEPLYTSENGTEHRIWEPVKDPSNPMFLQIDSEVTMISDPVKREMKFWETLGLNDSYAYEYA